MTTRTAACSCGQLSVVVEGEPLRVSVCHCLNCQRRSGSVFATQARFTRVAATISGRSTAHVIVGDGGGRATFHFCPGCGATVYYTADFRPDDVIVPVGAFADPAFPPPTVSVYDNRKHPWVHLPDDVEHWT